MAHDGVLCLDVIFYFTGYKDWSYRRYQSEKPNLPMTANVGVKLNVTGGPNSQKTNFETFSLYTVILGKPWIISEIFSIQRIIIWIVNISITIRTYCREIINLDFKKKSRWTNNNKHQPHLPHHNYHRQSFFLDGVRSRDKKNYNDADASKCVQDWLRQAGTRFKRQK